MATKEKINIPNYELEKLAKHLLPQIQKDFEKWQKEQIKRVNKSKS